MSTRDGDVVGCGRSDPHDPHEYWSWDGAEVSCPGEPPVSAVVEERIYFPTGMDPNHAEASHFAVRVQWWGNGQWAVVQGLGFPGHRFLSKTGRWIFLPHPMHRRYCRFTFAEACALAEQHVDAVTVNGLTWAGWQQRRAATP